MKDIIEKFEQANTQALKALKEHLSKVRTGRANVILLDGIMVDYYGTPTPIKQVANLSTPDARTIQVQAWETSLLPAIEKAIIGSNIGLTPMNDGKLIRVPVPPLTEERRKDLVKQCKKMAEETKVSVRNNRRDANDALKKLEKDGGLSEDESKRVQDDIQKRTDLSVTEVDKILAEKEKEILTI
ncbi:MAG: ribosome recycling factor [Oligoflexia bacterium]|nr:ribosome recycling factor [Oligoflexia bacterium]